MPHRVSIASPQSAVPLDRSKLRAAAAKVLNGEGIRDSKISLAVVDHPTIHRINKQFLDHDEPTDVVAFPFSKPKAKTLEGELVIGAEMAAEQAAERGHDVQAELTLYVIHGLLHLCGYDDHSERDRKQMRARERHYLRELGLPEI